MNKLTYERRKSPFQSGISIHGHCPVRDTQGSTAVRGLDKKKKSGWRGAGCCPTCLKGTVGLIISGSVIWCKKGSSNGQGGPDALTVLGPEIPDGSPGDTREVPSG